jgi:hypothetical protein
MSHPILMRVLVVLCVVCAVGEFCRAGVAPVESFTLDRKAGDVTVTLNFGHAPDFYTTDSGGRPLDSFQMNIAGGNKDPLLNPTTVLRGDEIQFANAIRVRNATPPDLTDSHSGGWGTVRGAIPFSVKGTELTFTAPLSLINVPDGIFRYDVFTIHQGTVQNESQGHSVPLPSSLAATLFTICIGIVVATGKATVAVRR